MALRIVYGHQQGDAELKVGWALDIAQVTESKHRDVYLPQELGTTSGAVRR